MSKRSTSHHARQGKPRAARRTTRTTAGPTSAHCATSPAGSPTPPPLAYAPRILDRFEADSAARGLVGEERAKKLLYLNFTSRLQRRPCSCGIKGDSSTGKSYLVEQVSRYFPTRAYYYLTGMSARALAYSTEPLEHRILVIDEAKGVSDETADYLIRSILSAGRVRYETVEHTPHGLRARLIDRPGPTGFVVTSTHDLHPENETRLLSVPTDATEDQTRAILMGTKEDGDDRQ